MGRCDLWLTSDRYLPLGCGRTGFSFPPDVHNYDGRVSGAAMGRCHHLGGDFAGFWDFGFGGRDRASAAWRVETGLALAYCGVDSGAKRAGARGGQRFLLGGLTLGIPAPAGIQLYRTGSGWHREGGRPIPSI